MKFSFNDRSGITKSVPTLKNIYEDRSVVLGLFFILTLCAGIRIWFWHSTHLILEDSLITFRYAENIAAGNGFVYNVNEHVLGTTTPLWTLILAAAKWIGANLLSISAMLGIIFDLTTCFLIILLLLSTAKHTALFFGLLFSASPVIVPITVSGMETSLLLLCMTIALFGYVKKNIFFGIGLALTILTRIDGVLFVGVFLTTSFLEDKKWTVKQIVAIFLLLLPWYLFSLYYFGGILPQSLIAKRAVYQPDIGVSAASFLSYFTPLYESHPIKIIVKSMVFIFMGIGFVVLIKRKSFFLPVGIYGALYSCAFILSGTIIFTWYLVPAVFVSCIIISFAVNWCLTLLHQRISNNIFKICSLWFLVVVMLTGNLFLIRERVLKYSQLQDFEQDVRQKIGLWVKNNTQPGATIFLEPIGYIGYFAGPAVNVRDEIGLVAPAVATLREAKKDWYVASIQLLNPDLIIQYADAIEKNKAEGTKTELFTTESEKSWFFSHYHVVTIVEATKSFPMIEQKEKRFIIFKRTDSVL